MKLLLWAILGILCFMAGPVGWVIWWGCVLLACGWSVLVALWATICAVLTGIGRLIGMDREGWR